MTEPTPYERVKNCEHDLVHKPGNNYKSCTKCGTDGLNCEHDDLLICSSGHSECKACGLVLSLSHTEAMKANAERDQQLDAFIGILTDYCKEHPEVIDKFFAKVKQ